MTLRLLLIRHGLSSFNLQNRIQGRNDLSTLTDQGVAQAQRAGQALSAIPIQTVYSSPLKRAAETTKELLRYNSKKIKPIYDQDLLEVDLASWSGLTNEEVQSQFPDEYFTWKKSPNKLVLKRENGSEYNPIEELMHQADKFLGRLLAHHSLDSDENILIVAHNAILRCIVLSLLNKPQNGFRRIRLDNASISVIKLNSCSNQTKEVQIESLNSTAHLDPPLPKKSSGARLILVRHGETNWNKEGRFQGQIDIPLNENGKEQAMAASNFLRKVSFNKAFSSSMSRPFETAKIILNNHPNLRIECLRGLVEIGHGQWEGKLETEIRETWGKLLDKWKTSPETVQMPNGENIQEVWTRATNCWEQISETLSQNETALVVAHDAVNKTILCHLLGLTPKNIWMIKQGNGGITVVDIPTDPSQLPVVTCLNITSHLGGVIDDTAQGAL
ncbi:histidine phosphatase family protein [Prochlorococcus marinus]|uniref:Possible alpha-ribazole-5'-P phosphatase n=1 Tax=Prochlorococcus marinus (strain MIT 9211) TaxID=93059 RepID=A9BED8_PROM4|nr:histidine phosphatase family protein [Prochlorococcus marinus]ABX08448.1 possible alpha-ribazole-5'-P phosphatase [Prochlorococcus marinus str. MIT 9211]